MKNNNNIKILKALLILIGLHLVTYSVDYKRVSESQSPIFAIRAIPAIKDGGSAIYYAIGYQVIKWHRVEESTNKRLIGYEIHRIPFFKSFEDGPDPNIKYADYYSHK